MNPDENDDDANLIVTEAAPEPEPEDEPEEQAAEEVSDDAADDGDDAAEEVAAEAEAAPEPEEPEEDDDDSLTGLPEGAKARLQRAARVKAAKAEEARRLAAENHELTERLTALQRELEAERLDGDGMEWEAYTKAKEKVLRGEARVVDGKLVEEKLFDGYPERKVAAAASAIRAKVERIDPALWEQASKATNVPLGGRMVMALAECQHPASVLRALLADPDLARHADSVSETKRQLIFDKHDKPAKAVTPPKRVTAAPAPISPTRGGAVPQRDPARMSFAEYEEWMNKQEAERLRRGFR